MNLLCKKKKMLFHFLTLTLISTFIVLPIIANAFSLEIGVTRFPDQFNIKIKYMQLGSRNLISYVAGAQSAWNNSAATVDFVQNSITHDIELISGDYGSIGWDGLCNYPTILNGNHSRITINETTASISGNETECIAHELGHALGLSHTTSTLMRKLDYNGSAIPWQDDVDGVNSFY